MLSGCSPTSPPLPLKWRAYSNHGRFVCTTWECRITPPGWPPQLADHHDILEQAGLMVEIYEETPDWERRQRAFTEAYLAAQADLVGLMSDPAYLVYRRRILLVARKAAR
jgi:hypothetical protein